jgi:hypothetical protein
MPSDREATIKKLWRNSGHGTRWVDVATAYDAGVAAERERWMALACDGWRVLQGLDAPAQKRTSHQNVSDTLDAMVRVMREA